MEEQGQQQGYGPTSTGRPVAIQPYGHPTTMEVETNPLPALGDHQPMQSPPRVTVQQTQVQIEGFDIANATALVPNTAVATGSPTKENLRSQVAYLQNQIEQTRNYAQLYNDEQKKHLLEEAQGALASQRAEFLNASERYEQEARDIARYESASAANQTETQLHTKFRQRMVLAEGDLSQQRQEEMAVVSRFTNALRNSEEEVQKMNTVMQQQQEGLTSAHSKKIARIEQSAENHYQQLQQVQLRTEGKARQEAEAVAEEKAKAEAMLRQATSSSTSSQYLAEELLQSQRGVTHLHNELLQERQGTAQLRADFDENFQQLQGLTAALQASEADKEYERVKQARAKHDQEQVVDRLQHRIQAMQDQMEDSIQAAVAQAILARGDLKPSTLPTTTSSSSLPAKTQRFDISGKPPPPQQYPHIPPLHGIPPRETAGFTPAARMKEADKVELDSIPTVPKFRSWKAHLRKAIAGASGRPNDAFIWICEIDEAATMEELGNSGDFETLDAKLADAFGRILHGELGRQIQIMEDKVAKTTKQMLKGRQIAWIVFERFKLNEEHGYVLDFEDLFNLELKNNNTRAFLNDWEQVYIGLKEIPPESVLESLFRRQVEKTDDLKELLALYNQDVTQRGESRSYAKLKTMVENHLEQKRRSKNRDDMRPGRAKTLASAGGDLQRKSKQGECRTFVKTGNCPRGEDCPWDHPSDVNPRGRSPKRGNSPKGKGGGKTPKRGNTPKQGNSPRPRSPSRGSDQSDKPPPCKFYLQGKCSKGKGCTDWHSPLCRFHKGGNCTKGKDCIFLHVKPASPADVQPATPTPSPPNTPRKNKKDKKNKDKTGVAVEPFV